MRVDILETPDLGDRSYVVSDGGCAIVVDPQRDIDRVQALLRDLDVPVTLVLETHLHNDYVTGGLALARATGATYVVAGRDRVAFDRCAVHDGDDLSAGTMDVRVLETPGHTDTHVSYVISGPEGPPAVFTGGSLLYGSVGRTDLLGADRTDELTRKQWHSARRLATTLSDSTPVYPTHGFGSFCSSGGASGGSTQGVGSPGVGSPGVGSPGVGSPGVGYSTIGLEKQCNDALTTDDEQAFVDALVAGLTGYPAYYAHMGELNAAGPQAPDLAPPAPVDPAELAVRLAAGEWVVDLRDKVAYAGRHLAGTVSVELGTQFSTYVGWIVPWGAPLTLLGQSPEQVADAQRQLVRIGIDRLAGAATGALQDLTEGVPLRAYPVTDFAGVAAEPGAQVLDVRRPDERAHGFLAGSVHLPLDTLVERMDEVPAGRVWVHCASGFRASIAASLLDRAGHDVVHVDDDYDSAVAAGLEVTHR